MLFLEGRPLAGHAFDQISEAGDLGVVVTERENVDLQGHGCLGGKLVFGEGAQDGLRTDHGVLRVPDDLARGTDRVRVGRVASAGLPQDLGPLLLWQQSTHG